jgi:hypothetical protein
MTTKQNDNGSIRVADITLAQLSRGLYKSTASVFKELVSNAHDADATEVNINTNYPQFDFISCVDNGTSMTLEEFLRYFSAEGIGSCIKRKHNKDVTDIYKRPIIGKLGIGMLAIAQLCDSFQIESHYVDEKTDKGRAYWAEIVLEDIFPFSDKEEIIRNDNEKEKKIPIGTWEYKEIEYNETKKGFRLYSSDVRKTFRDEMKASLDSSQNKKMSFNLSDLHTEFYEKSNKSIRDCKAYLETIWELGILCPLPYHGDITKCPIDLSTFTSQETKSDEYKKAVPVIRRKQQAFLEGQFRVVFDGIELKRYIKLPTEDNVISKLYHIEYNDKVYGSKLKFSGYLFAQVASAIRPLELNGIQIRLKGVGIGGYDSTFLKYYKQIETIRNRWVSGEIFVDEGLEIALNIDRDSFNEHDEHFKKIQSLLHDKLDKVFNEISNISRESHSTERSERDKKVKKELQHAVDEESKGKLKLVLQEVGKNDPIVKVDHQLRQIILNTSSRPAKNKKTNVIIQAIDIAYYTAMETSKNEDERHDKFLQLVKKILDKML